MRKLLWLLFVLSSPIWLLSQKEASSKIKFSLQGKVAIDNLVYFKKQAKKINSRNEGTVNLKGTIEFDEEAIFKIQVASRKDLQDDFRDRLGYVREAYFHFVDRKLDMSIGKQLASWGTADIYSPTNNLNPVDYTDFFDLEDNKLGVWMVKAKRFHTNRFFTEVLISPFLPTIAAPNTDSRWVVGLPSQVPHPSETNSFIPIQYNYVNLYPDYKDVGLMMGFRNGVTIGQWDVSQSFLVGPNFTPSFSQGESRLGQSAIQVDLAPIHQRQYVFGIDFATAFKYVGFRGEMALKGLSKENSKRGLSTLYYEYTIGLDRTFSRLIFNKNLTVIAQWVQQIILAEDRPMDNNIRFFLQRAMMLRTELALNYFSSFTIQALNTLDTNSWYIQASLKYRILDGWTVMARTDLVFGKANGFLGQFINNDRLQLKITYDF